MTPTPQAELTHEAREILARHVQWYHNCRGERFVPEKDALAAVEEARAPHPTPASDVVERVARAIARATVEAAEPEKFGRLSDAGIDALIENIAVKFFPEARAAIAALNEQQEG